MRMNRYKNGIRYALKWEKSRSRSAVAHAAIFVLFFELGPFLYFLFFFFFSIENDFCRKGSLASCCARMRAFPGHRNDARRQTTTRERRLPLLFFIRVRTRPMPV